METVLEILKYILPSLVVFAAVYYIQKQKNQQEYNMKVLDDRGKYSKDAIPLKLQAYERLLLFCDRITIPNLTLRLRTPDMSAKELGTAMIIAVQKEYEHNLAQQLYTSNKLWDILTLAKNDTIALISDTMKGMENNTGNQLAQSLMAQQAKLKSMPAQVATKAIKEEAKIILNV